MSEFKDGQEHFTGNNVKICRLADKVVVERPRTCQRVVIDNRNDAIKLKEMLERYLESK